MEIFFAIVIILVFIWWFGNEHMTRIRRGVGMYNDANETQVAAGIINSAPLLDYTHTYWDGVKIASCDECPGPSICPNCPQFEDSPEFTGRERMGATSSSRPRSGRATLTNDMGPADLRENRGGDCNAVLNILYGEVMNLDNPPPFAEGCEYRNMSGYFYKEACYP